MIHLREVMVLFLKKSNLVFDPNLGGLKKWKIIIVFGTNIIVKNSIFA